MIVLFDRVGDAFQLRRWVIELARDFDSKTGMTYDRVIVDRDPAVSGDEIAGLRQDERINFERACFDAAQRRIISRSNRPGAALSRAEVRTSSQLQQRRPHPVRRS